MIALRGWKIALLIANMHVIKHFFPQQVHGTEQNLLLSPVPPVQPALRFSPVLYD